MRSVYFDCDDTLAMWNDPDKIGKYGYIGYRKITIKGVGFYVHKAHVAKLKQHFLVGDEVTLWSHGGETWARVVAKALKITKFITKYATKPDFYYDDQDYGKLGRRIYLNFDGEVTTNEEYQDNIRELLR